MSHNPNAPGHNKPTSGGGAEALPKPESGSVIEPTSVESVDNISFIVKRQHYTLAVGEYVRQARLYGQPFQNTSPNVVITLDGSDAPLDIPLGGPQAGTDWRLVAA